MKKVNCFGKKILKVWISHESHFINKNVPCIHPWAKNTFFFLTSCELFLDFISQDDNGRQQNGQETFSRG